MQRKGGGSIVLSTRIQRNFKECASRAIQAQTDSRYYYIKFHMDVVCMSGEKRKEKKHSRDKRLLVVTGGMHHSKAMWMCSSKLTTFLSKHQLVNYELLRLR